jgi:hypothetical protein
MTVNFGQPARFSRTASIDHNSSPGYSSVESPTNDGSNGFSPSLDGMDPMSRALSEDGMGSWQYIPNSPQPDLSPRIDRVLRDFSPALFPQSQESYYTGEEAMSFTSQHASPSGW